MRWFTATLYFSMGAAAALITYLSTDDAVKYFDPALRFKLIMYLGAALAGINNVKAFMSMPRNDKPPVISSVSEPPKQP